jgi:hypothetical protein
MQGERLQLVGSSRPGASWSLLLNLPVRVSAAMNRQLTQWDGNPSRYLLFTCRWHHPAMESMGRVLGPASTNFNDYLGTVAADDAEAVLYEPSLYELANLDRDRYTILAVDLRVEGRTTATVYAVDRAEHPYALPSEITKRGQGEGDVPVVPFDLPEASAEEFIRHAFSRISVRLVTQPLQDHALIVTEPSSTKDIES